METKFELENKDLIAMPNTTIEIVGPEQKYATYVAININGEYYFIQDKDLVTFATNILKSTKRKRKAKIIEKSNK